MLPSRIRLANLCKLRMLKKILMIKNSPISISFEMQSFYVAIQARSPNKIRIYQHVFFPLGRDGPVISIFFFFWILVFIFSCIFYWFPVIVGLTSHEKAFQKHFISYESQTLIKSLIPKPVSKFSRLIDIRFIRIIE